MAGRVGGLDQAPRVRDRARAPRAQEHQRRGGVGGKGRVFAGGGVAVVDGGGGHWVRRSKANERDEAGDGVGTKGSVGGDARNLFGRWFCI